MVSRYRASPDGLLTAPIFIIGCNRSGTTALFRTLSAHPTLWSRYIENRDCFIDLFPDDGPEGDRVTQANDRQQSRMSQFLYDNAKNRELVTGNPVLEHLPLKLFQKLLTDLFWSPPLPIVDKTPSNCFRVEMLADAYPDARFVARRGEAVVSSLMEGWKNWTETDGTWSYRRWYYLKPPSWKDFEGEEDLARICSNIDKQLSTR